MYGIYKAEKVGKWLPPVANSSDMFSMRRMLRNKNVINQNSKIIL